MSRSISRVGNKKDLEREELIKCRPFFSEKRMCSDCCEHLDVQQGTSKVTVPLSSGNLRTSSILKTLLD